MKRYELEKYTENNNMFGTLKESKEGDWVKWEDVELLIEKLDGFLNAYPEDLFPEPTKDQYKEAHRLLEQIRPGFGMYLFGSWGRHITRCIADSLGTISDDVQTTKPD